MQNKLRRLLIHVRNGTVMDRLLLSLHIARDRARASLKRRRRAKRSLQWERCVQRSGFLDFEIHRGAILRLHHDSAVARSIFLNDFELAERAFVRSYLKDGDFFVDVGANIGLFTVLAAARVGQSGRVVAFEPTQCARRRLEENIQLNSLQNVLVDSRGLSNKAGTLLIKVPRDGHDAWSSFATPISGEEISEQETQTVTWDMASHDYGGTQPTMMKIDVEGWELFVLMGAASRLASSDAPLLQVEFTDAAAISAGHVCGDVYRQLVEFGYTVCRYDLSRNELVADSLRSSYPYVNLFATKNLRADNARLRNQK